jgi:myo-inositol-1-phosphate synthase
VWFAGARGSVATTTIVGSLLLRAGLARPVGCVTALPDFPSDGLVGVADLVFGGHDVVDVPLAKRAEQLVSAGVLPAEPVAAIAGQLGEAATELRPAPVSGDVVAAIAADLTAFRERVGADRVVVVNLTPTEPPLDPLPAHSDADGLLAALASSELRLPPSSLYACAAFVAGCSFVDFTPSPGVRVPAVAELAIRAEVPYAGNDGKTGETLLKSVLAPMFARRNLNVRSWSGLNLLGAGDGANLADPGARASKLASKDRVLAGTLGDVPPGEVGIGYVPDLGDWKTAWNLVTFDGFLGVPMRLEFTWHGCDSALAAPLVLDLARLVAAAHRDGRVGPLPELGFFFKDPLGDGPHGLDAQWRELTAFAAGLGQP